MRTSTRKPSKRMRRSLVMTGAVAAGLLCLANPRAGAPSTEQLFVAEAEAAAESGAICTMDDRDAQQQNAAAAQAAKLANTADTSSDLPPLRMVVDPYPSFN